MAEENKTTEIKEEPQSKEPTAIELKAMEEGWVPQEEWEGDPDQWRPAKEFVDRGELFKKIDDQNRTVKDLKRALDDMKRHHATVRETEYKRALESLKDQKKTAILEQDADAILQIDDKMDLVKEEMTKLNQEPKQFTQSEVAPEFAAWVNKNKWYNDDEPMRAYADAIGRSLAVGGMQPPQVLIEVEKRVKSQFKDKFENPNRSKPGAVEGSTSRGGRSNDSFALSDDERRVMQRFVRSGVMTEEQYIKDLKAVRGA